MMRDESAAERFRQSFNKEMEAEIAKLIQPVPNLNFGYTEHKPYKKLDAIDENGNPINSGDKARKAMRNIWFGEVRR